MGKHDDEAIHFWVPLSGFLAPTASRLLSQETEKKLPGEFQSARSGRQTLPVAVRLKGRAQPKPVREPAKSLIPLGVLYCRYGPW